MQEEKPWSYEQDGDRRGGTVTRPRHRAESSLLDPASSSRPSVRRFAPYPGTESDRDALAATALAALQQVAQAPSVLDVDAASLRLSLAARQPVAEPEPEWTPPVLPAIEGDGTLDADSADDQDEGELAPSAGPALSTRRNWFACVVATGLAALLGGGLFTTISEQGGDGVATGDTRTSVASVADPALLPEAGLAETDESAAPPIANVEGRLTLTEASLHDRPAGDQAPAATSFPVGAEVDMWLDLAYAGQGEVDRLCVVWYRGDAEFGREERPLADGPLRTRVPAPALIMSGSYRADVTLNDEVIASVPFDVTTP